MPAVQTTFLEALEERIAPAGLSGINFQAASAGTSILLNAGQGLATGENSGSYMMYVEQGQALVFTTDLNGNGQVDFNEITGIAAGNGLRLVSFVDINGDIVTNLNPDGTLTDSDGDVTNGRDGKVVLPNRIDSITLRTINGSDVPDPFLNVAKSNYSIYGNVYAGGGLGTTTTQGLTIDSSGVGLQVDKFGRVTLDGTPPVPTVGFIFTGSAVSGEYFSFGTSPEYGNAPGQSIRGELGSFVPAAGQSGGDVIGVGSVAGGTPSVFMISGIVTGDGGFGARGGNISNVTLLGDTGGLLIQAGNGGAGEVGGDGGSITNFLLTDSINSQVTILSGDGGYGYLGRAGNAGNISFGGELTVYANLEIGLGRGGDSLQNAGNGTSLSNGKFTQISPESRTPTAFVSTWRLPGDLGQTRQVDFNGDGFNDAIFLSDVPNQAIILFGDALGSLNVDPEFSYLTSPGYAAMTSRFSAVAIGEFGGPTLAGAPLPDIVTASSSGNSGSGLLTFVNRGFDASSGEWLGFANARYSPLPGLSRFDVFDPAKVSNAAVTNLAVGDFDKDGISDVAVLDFRHTGALLAPFSPVLSMMSGLTNQQGAADGYFSAAYDVASDGEILYDPVAVLGSSGGQVFSFILKSTATEQGDQLSDVMGLIVKDWPVDTDLKEIKPNEVAIYTIGADLFTNGLIVAGQEELKYSERVIKTVDKTSTWIGYGRTESINVKDFSFVDVDGNGVFDIIAVGTVIPGQNSQSSTFLASAVLEGQANGFIEQPLLVDDVNFATPQDYYGIALSEKRTDAVTIPSVLNSNATNLLALKTIGGEFPLIAPETNLLFSYLDPTKDNPSLLGGFSVTGFGQYNDEYLFDANESPFSVIGTPGLTNTTLFDAYPVVGLFDSSVASGFVFSKTTGRWFIPVDLGSIAISTSSLTLTAGDGGNSLLGRGGNGGSLGTGSISTTGGVVTGSLDLTDFQDYVLITGKGGFGFSGGGTSGNLNGLKAVSPVLLISEISLTTPDGGFGMLGPGGNAGSVNSVFLDTTLASITTGIGGSGSIGGTGGNVLGRLTAVSPDAAVADLVIEAGSGGFGMTRGGTGGSIQNFLASLGTGGIQFTAGDGGDSAVGVGGTGGSIVASNPNPGNNAMSGNVLLTAGDGGDGITGGAGGNIQTFDNRPTSSVNPSSALVFAGAGGNGVTGRGGNGGNVTGVSIVAEGNALDNRYNAFASGVGGISSAGTGGNGGQISALSTAAGFGASVALAGAGGVGFVSGGAGGNITNSIMNAGGFSQARVIAMAGKGGDAAGVTLNQINAEGSAVIPQVPGMFAMGTVNGRGGAGGSISGFTQPNNLQTSTDLVAGNGGNTTNYGAVNDRTVGVGRGGSVSAVRLDGDAGRIDPNVPIVSYSPLFYESVITNTQLDISNSTGNVGVIVGSSGLVRNGDPAANGLAGSVSNFRVKNVMSMVAGSVDRIAEIQSINGLVLQNGGTQIGVGKNSPLTPGRNLSTTTAYFTDPVNSPGVIGQTAFVGSGLIDGAVLTKSYSGSTPISSLRIFI